MSSQDLIIKPQQKLSVRMSPWEKNKKSLKQVLLEMWFNGYQSGKSIELYQILPDANKEDMVKQKLIVV